MCADVIAHWFDDVVTAEDHEIENETEPECANFIRLNVNDFGENFFHTVAAALWAARTRRTATRLQFLFLPRGEHFGFALRCNAGFHVRLSILRPGFEPGKRVTRGVIK